MARTDGITLDTIIDDCTLSDLSAAQALLDAMTRPAPGSSPAGVTQAGLAADAWASASSHGRAIARLLSAGDVIGYETRDALDEQVWDDLASRVRMTDTGSGMEVQVEPGH